MTEPDAMATANTEHADSLPALDRTVLAVLVVAKLALHVPGLTRYGYFRDELYFLDLARHLDWGYVDCAPLVAVYAKIALLMGGSLPALRVLPMMAGAGLVALTVVMTRELGGRSFAQALAGLCVLIAPIILGIDGLMTMNAFEPLFWMGCAWLVMRIVRSGESSLWLWVGVMASLGLQNKHSTVFFGLTLTAGVLMSPMRRELGRRWIWFGAAIATIVFLPNLVWQVMHDFPTIEDLSNVRRIGKNVALAPVDFVAQQVLIMHPITLPVWLSGLTGILLGRLSRYRLLGWTFTVFFGLMMIMKAKNYYLAPIYPMLFAAGGVVWESWTGRLREGTGWRWPRPAVIATVSVAGAILAPMFVPVLAPHRLVAYQAALGLAPPKTEVAHVGPLPQYFGDQFGWPELATEVSKIYWSLSDDERARAGVFASNYGEAGAINLFGPRLGLPPAICAHQNHWFWGPPDPEPEILIWLQWSRESLERLCDSVELAGEHHHPWGMAEENRPIYLCRRPRVSLTDAWPELKHWN